MTPKNDNEHTHRDANDSSYQDDPAQMEDGHARSEEAAWGAPQHGPSGRVIPTIVTTAILVGFVIAIAVARLGVRHNTPATHTVPVASTTSSAAPTPAASPAASDASQATYGAPLTDWQDPGPMSLAAMQEKRLIIDVHEHIESIEEAPMFIAAMDRFGIQKACLMGSSKFTLTMQEAVGFTQYDENNEELIKILNAYPGRFEAWPTLNPVDPDKLSKIQDLVKRGATGIKLYIGHGYVSRKHEYMFHTVAMDDPGMLPFYAWCEENFIPVVLHVNPFKDKKGFAQEFIAVLTQYPDLKVVAPHFILSSVMSSRLEELLDTFPNLYSDISFGDDFMKQRLSYISKYPTKFRELLNKYPSRFMFAADLVMIKGRKEDWAPTQYQAYIDMLTKAKYTSDAIPGKELRGLKLSDDLVSRILFRNYHAFRAHRPVNTKITHTINWERMNVEPIERKPGEAFPPATKQTGDNES